MAKTKQTKKSKNTTASKTKKEPVEKTAAKETKKPEVEKKTVKSKAKDTKDAEVKKTAKKEKVDYYESVGRRKSASARVRLYVVDGDTVTIDEKKLKKGDVIVNGRNVEEYFPGDVYKNEYLEPLRTTNTLNRFAVSIRVAGGGLVGQMGAVIHGLARALEKVDKDRFRPILKKRGFLTRDARVKERIKAGLAHSARAKKQSPKR